MFDFVFGVGFSIMSFNNDVSIDDMFSKISKQFTGDKEQGRKILEYCYSIGVGVESSSFIIILDRKN